MSQGALPSTVLVAGATGALGREVCARLAAAGVRVRALSRQATLPAALRPHVAEQVTGDLTRPATLDAACAGVDGVFSCAGAPLVLGPAARASFHRVDGDGNLALLAAARRAGVRRAAYVSVFGGEAMPGLDYTDAHERVARALDDPWWRATVVRPTGFFSVFAEVLRMARQGRAVVIGDGSARTNPVHEADVAELAVRAWGEGAREVAIGGPAVHSRLEIARLALAAAGRSGAPTHVPPGIMRAMARATSLVHPRLGALMAFGTEVSVRDVIAPAIGRRTLAEHFATLD